jgi:hypothetical protein
MRVGRRFLSLRFLRLFFPAIGISIAVRPHVRSRNAGLSIRRPDQGLTRYMRPAARVVRCRGDVAFGSGGNRSRIGGSVVQDSLPVFIGKIVTWVDCGRRGPVSADRSGGSQLFELLRGWHAPACGSITHGSVLS